MSTYIGVVDGKEYKKWKRNKSYYLREAEIKGLRDCGLEAWHIRMSRPTIRNMLLIACNRLFPRNPWLAYWAIYLEVRRIRYKQKSKSCYHYHILRIIHDCYWNVLSEDQKTLVREKSKMVINGNSEKPKERALLEQFKRIVDKEYMKLTRAQDVTNSTASTP